MMTVRYSSVAVAALLIGLPFLAGSTASYLPVSDFARAGFEHWDSKSFRGETRYELVSSADGSVLRAHSQGTASGLARRIEVDLRRTPFLNWSWRVDVPLTGLPEQTRDGDDYAARIYVIKSGGPLFWRTRAINYVWSSSQAAGSTWANAYTDRSWMMAVRGPGDGPGVWRREKRNVREDFQRLFGEDLTHIDAVALMTDTDDSGLEAAAAYGEIYFSAQ